MQKKCSIEYCTISFFSCLNLDNTFPLVLFLSYTGNRGFYTTLTQQSDPKRSRCRTAVWESIVCTKYRCLKQVTWQDDLVNRQARTKSWTRWNWPANSLKKKKKGNKTGRRDRQADRKTSMWLKPCHSDTREAICNDARSEEGCGG